MKRGYHLGRDIDRVNCLMRRRAVASPSDYPDHERVRCRHYRTSFETKHSRVQIAVYVKAKYIVDLGILHYAVFDHWFRSSPAPLFLSWLKEELHCALKLVLVVGEEFGCSEKHCDMCIMSAGVHYPFDLGLEFDLSYLIKG